MKETVRHGHFDRLSDRHWGCQMRQRLTEVIIQTRIKVSKVSDVGIQVIKTV